MELREVFEPLVNFLKSLQKKDKDPASKEKAKERLQLVLLQDRASVSPDFFEMMKKEIIEVIKKYIEIDEESLEVQLTRGFEDGDESGPALYANIPIKNIKPVAKKVEENDDDDLVTEIVNNENIVEENVQDANIQQSNSELDKSENIQLTDDSEKKNFETVVSENDVVENETQIKNEVDAAVTETMTEVAEEIVTEDITEKDINEIAASAQVDLQEEQRIERQVAERLEAIEKQDANMEAVKEKINEVKDGMAETFEKVKKGAKDGIKKIKTKTQKKKIKE